MFPSDILLVLVVTRRQREVEPHDHNNAFGRQRR